MPMAAMPGTQQVARGADIAATYPEPWQRVEAFRQLLRETAQINFTTPRLGG